MISPFRIARPFPATTVATAGAALVIAVSFGTGCAHEDARDTVKGEAAERDAFRESGAVPFVEQEILVRYRPGVRVDAPAALRAVPGSRRLRAYSIPSGLLRVEVPDGTTVDEALRAYAADPDVLYAEPNYVYSIDATPDDPYFPNLWGLHNTGQTNGTPDADVNAPEAWDMTTGSPAVALAVVDTGIDYTHVDLTQNMWVNPGEIPGNGIDDDQNGYVDDVHGINAITSDGDPMDDYFHGTHVAGIIGARGDNGQGVAGVNWNASLIACKFIGSNGQGTLADALTCLGYLHDLKTREVDPVDVVVSNNSWGGGGFSRALREAIDAHREAGILFVAAAGNSASNNDLTGFLPASYYLPNVLAVAATDDDDARASFSSFGSRTVHVGAPGTAILSTLPSDGYASVSGTSMAAPHVTGLLGLLKSQDPTRDWRALRNLLLAGGQEIPALAGITVTGRRIRAADGNGAGSMTCAGQDVQTRLRPIAGAGTFVARGAVAGLSALHLDCAAPAGEITVDLDPGATTLTLADGGTGFDQAAGDGTYSAEWIPTSTGSHTITFPGPDPVGAEVVDAYRTPAEIPFAFRSIAGTNLGVGDEGAAAVTAPFPIRFGGHSPGFTGLNVHGNGLISLSESVSNTRFNRPLPESRFQTLVAPFWDDLQPATSGACGVFSAVLGTAGNREFVVEWRDVPHYSAAAGCPSPSGTVTFQVVFFEDSSDILFNYADVEFGDGTGLFDKGASATVGMQVAGGVARPYSYNVASLDTGLTLRWTADALPQVTVPTFTPTAPLVGEAVTFSASFTDPDGASDGPWIAEWDFDYDGVIFTSDASASLSSEGTFLVAHAFDQARTYSVAARVRDAGGMDSSPRAVAVAVDAANEPPSPPAVSSPLSGASVATTTPTLVVDNAVDPEGAALSYVFQLWDDPSTSGAPLRTSPALPEGGNGATAWTVTPSLADNTRLYWRATAFDPEGASAESGTAELFVNLANDQPTTPALIAPADGSVLAAPDATLVVENATDADGDLLAYQFEVDTSPTFNSPALLASQAIAEGSGGSTGWDVSGLTEDAVHYWRARALDPFVAGDWMLASFRVNAQNSAPGTPVVLGPAGDALITTRTPRMRVQAASDPDGDPLTYRFELRASRPDGPLTNAAAGIPAVDGQAAWKIPASTPLRKGTRYFWTAWAVDPSGAQSPPAGPSSFRIHESGSRGCGCDLETGSATNRASPLHVLLLFAILMASRWRRRRRIGA